MSPLFRLMHQWFIEEVWAVPGRLIAAFFFVVILWFPLYSDNPYYLRIIIMCNIFSIFAVSFDVLAGFAGQLNLGHALFFGVGNYAVAFLGLNTNLPVWVTIPLSGFASVLVGMIAGISALRLKGFYLALVTFCFPIIVSGIILIFEKVTGGDLGLSGWSGISDNRTVAYYIIVGILLLSVYIMYKFVDTGSKVIRTGIILQAIREDEISARTSGISTSRYKILAFAVSGFFAGIAGGLYGLQIKVAGPAVFSVTMSFQVVIWSIFGGIGTLYGPLVGVYILYPIMELLQVYLFGAHWRHVILAVLLMVSLLYMPEGVAVWVRDKLELQCPRCKLTNFFRRKVCRACRAPMRINVKESL